MKQVPPHERKICFMNSNRVWGGGEKWHYETAVYLSKQGYDIMLITNKQSQLFQKLHQHTDFQVHSYRISNYSFLNPFKVIALSRLLKKHDVDTIILGLSNDLKAGGIAAKMAGVQRIIYRRGTALPVKNSFLNRYLFGSVLTHVIANSDEIKRTIFGRNNKIIQEDRVKVIYNGIQIKKWIGSSDKAGGEISHKPLIIGNAGRLVAQKDHETLIRIAARLKERGVDFKIRIAGAGELESSLKRLCVKENLRVEVEFTSFVDHMEDFLSAIDIYCSTSQHEGSSHVILEAMAAGKPLIAFHRSSFPELISEGLNGYLVPPGDINYYAQKIIDLDRERAAIERMGMQSRKIAEEKFNFDNKVEELVELIESEI